jgi:cytochrome c oxidase assembly protein Cox11
MMRSISARLLAFLKEERGENYIGFSYLMITFAASFPIGFACVKLYHAICAAGGAANLIIGLF